MSTFSPLSSGVTSLTDEIPVVPTCPQCGGEDSRVRNVRLSALFRGCLRRRRECLNPACKARFTTVARECLAPPINRRRYNP